MEQKDLIGMALLLAATCGGVLIACISQRVRDVFFFLLVTLSAVTQRVDINFVSRDWYRGVTRGFEVSLVDVIAISLLVATLLLPRHGGKRWFWPASFGLMTVYFCFAAFCVAMADPKLFGLFQLSKMLRGLIVFLAAALFVRRERELRLFLVALACAVCYEGLIALQQRYQYGIHRVFGSVDDSNSLSMYFCTTAPVFVAVITSRLPKYLKALAGMAMMLACVGVILTISRTGTVAIALVLMGTALATMSYRLTAKRIAIAMVVIIGIGGVTAKSWETLSSRYKEASMGQEYKDKRSQNRGYYIRLAVAIAKDTPFGVGPNNWSYWVSNKYGPRLGFNFVPYVGTDREPSQFVPAGRNIDAAQAAPAHSLGALTAGEMGIGGFILLALLWIRWLQMGASFLWPRTADPMRRIGVGIFFGFCGTSLQSLTEWVFHQTPIFFTLNIMLGVLASLYYARKLERKAAGARTASSASSEADESPQVLVHDSFARIPPRRDCSALH